MGIAEHIYETVKALPEQQAAEILDFAEFLKTKQTEQSQARIKNHEQRKTRLLEYFSQFQIDMSAFKFDREDANARR